MAIRTLLTTSSLVLIGSACSPEVRAPGVGTPPSDGSGAAPSADGGSSTSGGAATGGFAAGGTSASGGTSGATAGRGDGSGGASSGAGGARDGSGGTGELAIEPAFDSTIDSSTLTFQWANATNYSSYPDPGSEECIVYNGCMWAGYFAAVDGQQTEQWVKTHNIVAFFSAGDGNAGFETYQLKRLRLRKNGQELDVRVYDTCGDSDCDGCCTTNATRNGYSTLIDLESYTYARFGQGDGPIEWACLDCN